MLEASQHPLSRRVVPENRRGLTQRIESRVRVSNKRRVVDVEGCDELVEVTHRIECTDAAASLERYPAQRIRMRAGLESTKNDKSPPAEADGLSNWWAEKDLNLRSLRRQVYSLLPLAARAPTLNWSLNTGSNR